jgi:hypothetical protein
MAIKSEYLIHWTGKDINTSINNLTNSSRDKYLERLKDTCCKTGLWMMPNNEQFEGIGKAGFSTFSHITCFTENRINYYKEHAEKYGLLGFGFSKEWVLERDGMPVIYLKNDSTDIHTKMISDIVIALQNYTDNNGNIDKTFYNEFSLLFDYAKPMSNPGTKDFKYLEEAEWRICWNNNIDVKKTNKNTGVTPPEYFLPFKPDDLKLIVLPDNTCRKMAMSDPVFLPYYQSGNCEALILSLQEIEKL